MNKIIILLLLCSVPFIANAQMAVTDVTMLNESIKNWSLQIENAKKQYDAISEQSSLLQESIDKYKKVNSYIKNSRKVKTLIDNQVKVVSFLSTEINKAGGDIQNQKAYDNYIGKLNALLNVSQNNIAQLSELLIDDALNLSDFERMETLNQLSDESSAVLRVARMERQKYEKLNGSLKEIKRLTKVN